MHVSRSTAMQTLPQREGSPVNDSRTQQLSVSLRSVRGSPCANLAPILATVFHKDRRSLDLSCASLDVVHTHTHTPPDVVSDTALARSCGGIHCTQHTTQKELAVGWCMIEVVNPDTSCPDLFRPRCRERACSAALRHRLIMGYRATLSGGVSAMARA